MTVLSDAPSSQPVSNESDLQTPLLPQDDEDVTFDPAADAPPIFVPPTQGDIPVAVATSAATPAEAPASKPVQPSGTTATGTAGVTTTTTTTTTAAITLPNNLGRDSCDMTCPYCRVHMRTRTKDEIDNMTLLVCVILLFFFWPLCWIPLVCQDCKRTDHVCTNCNRIVGEKKPCS